MTRPPAISLVAPLALLALVAVVGLGAWASAGAPLPTRAAHDVLVGWWTVVANPWYVATLVVLGLLQWAFPARLDVRAWSVGLAQDLTWFVLSTMFVVTVVGAYLAVLKAGVNVLANGWRPDITPLLGTGGAALIAFVLADLGVWWSHRLHHRLPKLWEFHAVHHSQTSMNVLSDNRQHVVETIINATWVYIPARLLGLDGDAASSLAFLTIYYSAFIHANVRTDLGSLRFVFISPQAHRVHHSADPAHYDTNFGTVFSFWDHLFGTAYSDRHAYPQTGIQDMAFPMEHSVHPLALIRTWCAQTAYPFKVLSGRSPVPERSRRG